MILTPRGLLSWLRSPTGQRALRYSAVSAISIVISQAVLFLTFGVLRLASAVDCNIIATAAAVVPSYYLNRSWAWGKHGSSHLWREVAPFWALAFLGLVLSLIAVDVAAGAAKDVGLPHLMVAVVVNVASFAAYGINWVGKFIIFDRLLFVERAAPQVEAPGAHGAPAGAVIDGTGELVGPAR